MNLVLFYHIADMIDSQQVVERQVERLKTTGLLDKFDYIHITYLGTNKSIIPLELISKADSILTYDHVDVFENPTINRLRLYAQENPESKILYLYNKAVSYPQGEKRSNCESWGLMMEHFLIDHHDYCISLLDVYDTVGILKSPYHHAHYMGNYWWTKSSYVKKLPFLTSETSIRNNPLTELESRYGLLRHDAELWLFRANPKWLSLFDRIGLEIVKDYFPEDYYWNQIVLRTS